MSFKQDDLIKRINKKVLALSGDETIDAVIRKMIEFGVSSAIVIENGEKIGGIITERDIMRRISVLDIERKLDKPVRTAMTRPVEFVCAKSLVADIKRLHTSKKLRHFPVLKDKSKSAVRDNFLGILTASDICRAYLDIQ